MNTTLELVRLNLLSPMVLCFVLGAAARLLRSDLRLPETVYAALSTYLLLAIGLKGGVALSEVSITSIAAPLAATILLGTAIPFGVYLVARRFGSFGVADSAALAAHYGSVSAVTFIASLSFLAMAGVKHEGYLAALVAVMEIPAIVVALLLARKEIGQGKHTSEVVQEILAGKSIVLLAGGMVIGWLCAAEGFARVAPFFVDPFQGVLCLFLLEMGLLAANRLQDIRKAGVFLVVFGIGAPIVQGAAGVLVGHWSGLSTGGATVLGCLAASASYIAAPAAVRLALPQANPSYYLTAAIGITFPFNLAFGIPLYHAMAVGLSGGN